MYLLSVTMTLCEAEFLHAAARPQSGQSGFSRLLEHKKKLNNEFIGISTLPLWYFQALPMKHPHSIKKIILYSVNGTKTGLFV